MITITKIYNAKKEFKLLSSGLRFVKRWDGFYPVSKENEYTHCIDRFVTRWKKIEISKDTMHKLHRYAIAYRHNEVTKGV